MSLSSARAFSLLVMAGQIPWWNGERRWIGKLGREFTVEQGQEAAKLCGLNLVAQLDSCECGAFR